MRTLGWILGNKRDRERLEQTQIETKPKKKATDMSI